MPKSITTESTDSTSFIIPDALSNHEMIEMLKDLAAVKEKLHKWQQSVKKLETFPDSDVNKSIMKDIIKFIEQDKSPTQNKSIYLYAQLGHKCHENDNFIGAAKAYEKAATLRLESPNFLNEKFTNETKITVQYLESAILNYDAIHKYRHAGVLHHRCSQILSLANASPAEVARHYNEALEHFTMRKRDFKYKKRADGQKISCYSSGNQMDFYQSRCRDANDFMSSLPKYDRYSVEKELNNSANKEDYYISSANSSKGHEKYNVDCDLVKNGLKPLRKDLVLKHEPMKQNRRFEERVESAKKLVKKLKKFCPHYEVNTKGEKAGRVYCKVCERHLGAVSSTLKNHINTQDHRQALEKNTVSVRNEKNKTNELNRISYSNNNYNSINPRNSSNLRDFNAVNNNGSEFDTEIAWFPGFQSPNSYDFSTF